MTAAKAPPWAPNREAMRRTALVLALIAVPAAAHAAERMFTYDSASQKARDLTGAGLTLTFDQGLFGGVKLKTVQATAVPVAAQLSAAARGDAPPLFALLPQDAGRPPLYEVDRKADQGEVLSRAFCPDSKRVWLAHSPLTPGRPLTLWALSEGGGGGDALRLCATMDFAWRGEWRLPPARDIPAPRPLTAQRGPG